MSYEPDIDRRNYDKFMSPEGFTYYHLVWPIGKLPTPGDGSRKRVNFEVGSKRFQLELYLWEANKLATHCFIGGPITNINVGRAMLSNESTGCTLYGTAKCEFLFFNFPTIEDERTKAADDYVIHYWIDIFNGNCEKLPEQPYRDLNTTELFSSDMAKYFDGVKNQFDEDPSSFSDVVLVTKRAADGVERRFYCHRMILAARSPVFKTMLTNPDFEESRTRLVDIEDISSECMECVLQYIYTGVHPFDYDACNMAAFMDDRVFEILYAAQKYALPELIDMCGRNTFFLVDDTERLDVLRVAELYNLDWLKRFCIMALSTNMAVLRKEECRGKISDVAMEELTIMCANRLLKTMRIQVPSRL